MAMTPGEYVTASWYGWTEAVRAVVDTGDVGADGLWALVEELKRGRWVDDADRPLPPAVSARRLLLLDELCRACATARGATAWPLPGDLVGLSVPDDLADEDGA